MKRAIAALIATAVFSLLAASVMASEIDLKTSEGVKQFWQNHQVEGGGANGGN